MGLPFHICTVPCVLQAANTTEMWIITDGVDTAVSKMIGEAIQEERARRECKQLQLSHIGQDKVHKFQKLTIIGIVPRNVITYSDLFEGNVSLIRYAGDSLQYEAGIFFLYCHKFIGLALEVKACMILDLWKSEIRDKKITCNFEFPW